MHHSSGFAGWFHRLTRVGWQGLLLAGLVGGTAGAAAAQAPEVLSTYDRIGTAAQLAKVRPLTTLLGLRPNVTQPIYLYARTGAQPSEPYTVTLVWINQQGARQKIATAQVAALPANTTQPITGWSVAGLPAAAPAPAAPVPATPAPKTPVGLELTGQSPLLQIQLTPGPGARKSAKPAAQSFRVGIDRPTEYLNVTATESAGTANVVEFKVTATDGFYGPPCPLQLDLAALPGLNPAAVRGIRNGKIAKPGDQATLVADLGFLRGASRVGAVSLTADGYSQTQRYDVNFAQPTAQPAELRPVAEPKLNVGVHLPLCQTASGLMFCSRPVEALPVQLQVYTPGGRAGRVAAWFDYQGRVGEKIIRDGTREQHIFVLPPKPDGALVFQTTLRDWTLTLATPGAAGVMQLNAELYLVENGRPTLAGDYRRDVLFSDTPPTDVTLWADLATERVEGVATPILVRGQPLVLRATARDDAGIAGATFFLGKLAADNKLPADAIPGKRVTVRGRTFWQATVALPPKLALGPLDVGVLFTDNVGLSSKEAAVIILKEPAPRDTTIEGDITVGDLLQPKMAVQLRDDKNVVKASTATDDNGHYKFTHVVPGAYRVTATKVDGSHGEKAVEVQKGDQKKGIDLSLLR